MGDTAHIMPVVHPSCRAPRAGRTSPISTSPSPSTPISPTRLSVMTAIDLLWEDAAPARKIIAEFEPAMTKDQYLAFERGIFKTELWKAEA